MYTFLEIFFDVQNNPCNGWSNRQADITRECEENNDIEVSLEDDALSSSTSKPYRPMVQSNAADALHLAPLPSDNKDKAESSTDNGILKQAYDDALVIHGLTSVSRNSEILTDLALPAKIRYTISQELIQQQQMAFSSFNPGGG